MADIEVVCPKCSAKITVSEFADPDKLVCRGCGASVPLPRTAAAGAVPPPPKFGVKRSGGGPEEPASAAEARAATVPRSRPRKWKRARGPRVQLAQNTPLAWALFVIIAGITGFLRYGNVLPGEYLELIKQYSVIVVIGFHVVVVIKSFSDSVFQGMLCLLIPMYSLFYLFTLCDDFVLRAVFGGLLVGTAQDSTLIIHREIGETILAMQEWINRQGEYGP